MDFRIQNSCSFDFARADESCRAGVKAILCFHAGAQKNMAAKFKGRTEENSQVMSTLLFQLRRANLIFNFYNEGTLLGLQCNSIIVQLHV